MDRDRQELTSQAKGVLFENFATRLLALAGYENIVMRQKHNSLEYDVEALHSLTHRRVVGEAKAQESNISGQDISAFVGKLLPLAMRGDVDAVFLSISPFTADARDYLSTLPSGIQIGDVTVSFQTLVGDDIYRFLVSRGSHVSEEVVRKRIGAAYGLDTFESWLVITNSSEFVVCACGVNPLAAPTHYCAMDQYGAELELGDSDRERLSSQVPDLQGLQQLFGGRDSGVIAPMRELPGIVVGSGWFDYKFPSAPENFIGRNAPLETVQAHIRNVIQGETSSRTLQIMSRSGVGKSSLLVSLPTRFPDLPSATVDGRSLRVPSDVRLLVNELVQSVNNHSGCSITLARTQEEVGRALLAVHAALETTNAVALVQIDQFESALTLPQVFRNLLDLFISSSIERLRIVWVLARKNDVAATFDESAEVDLARLNEISIAVHLSDFTSAESQVLLGHLAAELGQRLTKDLTDTLLTFSAGFPWLQKRLCAHILLLYAAGLSQREMVQGGLRAEDLFEEDLAVLSESDRALLRKLAVYMPNTAAELLRRLEPEITAHRLAEKLNAFLATKLLRLSGDVYDTYNDVFKTYLVTDRVPFQSRYLFRVTPKATIETLYRIQELGPIDLASFSSTVGGNQIATINKLRELRLLGLIEPRPGRVALSQTAQAALEQETLGETLRKALRANSLVLNVLDLISSRGSVTISDIVLQLQRELPSLSVTSATWDLYAGLLVKWLRFAGLINRDIETLTLRENIGVGLPQFGNMSRGNFGPDIFLPSIRPNVMVRLLELLRAGPLPRRRIYAEFTVRDSAGLLRDAAALDVAIEQDGLVHAGRQGLSLLSRGSVVSEKEIAELALSRPTVKALLDAASMGYLTEDDQKAVLAQFGTARWTDSTWRWRLSRFRAWLVGTGYATSTKFGLIANGMKDNQQLSPSLFDQPAVDVR